MSKIGFPLEVEGDCYYKARIYSPTLGRFMQTDPIGYGAGLNLYAYVGNDPVNFADLSGLTPMATHPEIVDATITHSALVNPVSGSVHGGFRLAEIKASKLEAQWTQYGKDRNGKGVEMEGDDTVVVTTPAAPPPPPAPPPAASPPPPILAPPQKEQPKPAPEKEDKYACLEAVGGGALSTALDPISLVATGTAGVVTSTGAVGRAAYPVGRALTLARAAFPGFAIATGVAAGLGGLKAYLTDPRCK